MTRSPESLGLRRTQRLFAQAIMRPMAKGQRIDPAWIDGSATASALARIVKPNDRLSSLERTEIYNRQYWFRILDSFHDDFPGLRAALGPDRFDRLATQYLIAHPSRSFTLRNLGQCLVQFLIKNPRLTSPRTALAIDMARFEWAQIEAFDGPSKPPVTAAEISGTSPTRLKLRVQPYVSLLDLAYPLDDFVLAVKKHAATRDDASNAVGDRTGEGGPKAKSMRKKKIPPPRRRRTLVAVHRFENELYYRRLDHDEWAMLTALDQGKTLSAACLHVIEISPTPDRRWIDLLREWTAAWTRLGWLYRPGQSGST